MKLHVLSLFLWFLGLELPLCYSMLIVQSYEEDPFPSKLNTTLISINISREIIQNEVYHNIKSIDSKIESLQSIYTTLVSEGLNREQNANFQIDQISRKLRMKDKLICQILEDQRLLEEEVSILRKQIRVLVRKTRKKLSVIGIPQWIRKLKQNKANQNYQPKVNQKERKPQHKIHAIPANTTGIPEWVLRYKLMNENSNANYCKSSNIFSSKGVPQWVKRLKLKRYHQKCMAHEISEEYNVLSSYSPIQHGYESARNSDDPKEETDKKSSKKSVKRKIDEAFLTLMIRSKRLSWIDIDKLGENVRLFVDHATEIGRLCSWAVLSRNWENLEHCKEKIGLNFAISLVVALVTTASMLVLLAATGYTLHQTKVHAHSLSGNVSAFITTVTEKIKTLHASSTSKSDKRSLKSFVHSADSKYVCILTGQENESETTKYLITRLSDTNEEQHITPMYCYTHDFLDKPQSAAKYILVVNLNNKEEERMFENPEGKSANYKILEQMMKNSDDLLLLCINDTNSKQLPKGRLHNKSLVTANDNYLVRGLCRNDKFISINKEFTPSQATRINEWLHQ